MTTHTRVKDVMTKNPITVPPGTNIQACAKLMETKHIGSLLVKDGPGVVGIITEQDIVRKVVIKNLTPSDVNVDDIMATDLFVVNEDQDVTAAITIMRNNNIRHLPVMNKKEQFVGFVTSKDILRIQPDLFKLLTDKK